LVCDKHWQSACRNDRGLLKKRIRCLSSVCDSRTLAGKSDNTDGR
jgi:hypothetical protein